MLLKAKIQSDLAHLIFELYSIRFHPSQIQLDFPSTPEFGDYTTNVAMTLLKVLPKELKQSPVKIAEKLSERLLKEDNQAVFDKIEAVAPGFINLTLSLSYLHNFLGTPLDSEINQLQSENRDKDKILVEFIGPNTNKPLHIGHLRNACLGQALLNLYHSSGKKVISANINNDRGIHIIKSMYGYLMYGRIDLNYPVTALPYYKDALNEWISTPSLWHTPQSRSMKPDHFVGYYYILGNTDYELSEKNASPSDSEDVIKNYAHEQMHQMLISWEANDPQVRKLWEQNNRWYYEGMKETLRHFGISSPNNPASFFDKEWYESEIYKQAKDIVENNIGKGVITQFEDGHVEASLEKYNLPNIVLLRKNKTSLYITQDIELMRKRIQEDQATKIIILTGQEQNLRFQQLFAICDSLGIAPLSQMHHFGYGMVRLPDGKMSSRKGNVILIDELIAMVEELSIEKINLEHADYSQEEKEKISKQVAIAAIKYGILKYNAQSNIIFDIESSISFEGDTGPYLQYTYARTASILRKYQEKYPGNRVPENSSNATLEALSPEESELLRHLYRFSETIVKAAQSYSPNYLCEYLFNLCQKFNYFYTTKTILNEKNLVTQDLRLLLVRKTNSTLNYGLSILGIEAPEKM